MPEVIKSPDGYIDPETTYIYEQRRKNEDLVNTLFTILDLFKNEHFRNEFFNNCRDYYEMMKKGGKISPIKSEERDDYYKRSGKEDLSDSDRQTFDQLNRGRRGELHNEIIKTIEAFQRYIREERPEIIAQLNEEDKSKILKLTNRDDIAEMIYQYFQSLDR
jgi:hypothetical protein